MRRAGGRLAKLEVDGRVVDRVELASSNGERRKGLLGRWVLEAEAGAFARWGLAVGSTVRPTDEEA